MALLPAGLAAAPALAIVAGQPPDTPAAHVDPNTPSSPYSGVVSVGCCSGVVVGRRHVLTAAHVAVGGVATVRFNLGASPTLRNVVRTTIHPGYNGSVSLDLTDDLALLELAEDVPAGAAIYRWATTAPAARTTGRLVGYGATGQGSVGITAGGDPAIKRSGLNALDGFYPASQPTAFYLDFDGPTAATNVLNGQRIYADQAVIVSGTTLGNAAEVHLASGDSGAPVFAEGSSPLLLIGIGTFVGTTSTYTVAGTFGTFGGGKLVYAYAGWIDGVIQASGVGAPASNDAPVFGVLGVLPAIGGLALVLAARRRRHPGVGGRG